MKKETVKNVAIALLSLSVLILGISNYQSYKENEAYREVVNSVDPKGELAARGFLAGQGFGTLTSGYIEGVVPESDYTRVKEMVDAFIKEPKPETVFLIFEEEKDIVLESIEGLLKDL